MGTEKGLKSQSVTKNRIEQWNSRVCIGSKGILKSGMAFLVTQIFFLTQLLSVQMWNVLHMTVSSENIPLDVQLKQMLKISYRNFYCHTQIGDSLHPRIMRQWVIFFTNTTE